MARVVEAAVSRFGEINGVVHAAGVSSPSLALDTEPGIVRRIFAPKVKGALILEQLLAETPLDFFISFSSIAGSSPARGQSAYSSANAVLDALARRGRRPNWRRLCAIGWAAWEEAGMAAEHSRSRGQAALLSNPGDRLAEVVAHPLWQFFRRDDGRLLFSSELSPEHWALDEHRIGGIPTLPGTAILEMALGAFRHLRPGDQPAAISNIAFLRLMQVPPDGLEVWLICKEDGAQVHFELRGRKSAFDGQRLEDLALYCTGTISPIEGTRSIEAAIPGGDAHAIPENPMYRNSPHWDCVDGCIDGGEATVLRLSLPGRYRPETRVYELHPALLDRALAYVHITRMKGAPASIDELCVYRRLPPAVTAIVRDSLDRDGAVSIQLVDDGGQLVVEATNYVQLPIDLDKIRRQAEADAESGGGPLRTVSEAEAAKLGLSASIPLKRGLDVFQELLQSGEPLPHVLVTPQPLSGAAKQEPAIPSEAAAADPRAQLPSEYRPPSNPVEERLIGIWTEILLVESIGVDDSFIDLGGDSITSIQVLSRIRREWGVGLPGGALFENPTVSKLAKTIEGAPAFKPR